MNGEKEKKNSGREEEKGRRKRIFVIVGFIQRRLVIGKFNGRKARLGGTALSYVLFSVAYK